MADKVARRGVSIYIDGSKVINSVKGIKSEMAKLTNEQAKMVYMSDEYVAHARKIAQLDNILQQHKDYQKEITKEYGKMSGAADDFEKKSKKAFSLDSIASGINKLKGAIVGFIASFTVDKAIDEFAKLDDAQANVQKYTGLTRAEIKELNKDFDSLDTRTARIRLNELAGDAGRLGIQSRKDILDFVDAANIIDVALGEDLGEDAIKSIGKLAQMFGDSDRMGLRGAMLAAGSAINEVAQNSSAAEPYLVDFTNRMAGVGIQADISIPKLIGYASVLDQNAQEVEKSSTALSKLIVKLYQDPAKFAKTAGLDVKEFSELVKNDANEALLTLFETLGKKGGLANLAPILKELKLEGSGASATVAVLAGNIEKIRKEQKTATDAFAEGKSVINEYDVQNNTFSANLEKQKNVLLGYITDIGEKLAPMVLEGASAGNMLLKVFTSLITILIDNKEAVLTVVGAYLAYNVALKAQIVYQTAYNAIATVARLITLANAGAKAIETGNTIRAAAAQKLYYTTLEKGGAVTKAYIAVTSLLAAAKALLTGNLVAARAAMIQFNTVVAANPLGAFLAIVTAVGGAIYIFSKRTKEVTQLQKSQESINKKVNNEIDTQKSKIDVLVDTLNNEKIALNQRKKALAELKSIIPGYHADLTDEGVLINSNTDAIKEYLIQLEKQIRLKAAQDELEGLYRKKRNQERIVEEKQARADAAKNSANTVIPGQPGYAAGAQGLYSVESQAFADTAKRELADTKAAIDGIRNEIQQAHEEFTEPIITVTDDTGGSGSGGSGDKTSVQRKKINDALRTLEEQHLKDMSTIKQDYLNGDILSEEAYNDKIQEQQDKYDEDRKKKLQDLLKSISDASLRTDLTKQIAEIEAKALDRQIADKSKKQKDAAKKEQDLLKWNQDETKKILDASLKYIATEEDKAYIEQMELRLQGKISEAKYQKEITEIQKRYLEERLRINGLTEEQISDIRRQILENDIDALNDAESQRKSLLGNDIYSQLTDKMKTIDEALLSGAVTFGEAVMLRVEAYTTAVSDAVQLIGTNLSGAWTNYASAEESAISRRYDKEIAAAEGNSKKQKKLEEQKQKEINAVKAKYADKQFAVAVAQTISSTSVAAMEAYKAMAGIPVVGPALGAAAAAAAIAYGHSQIAVAKEQRDAAKEGYFDGGFTGGNDPRQVRAKLPNGEPVHGMEFVANRHSTANGLLRPVFDLIDDAQKHNTVSSLTRSDLAKALNIPSGYMQGGYNGSTSSTPAIVRDTRYDESYERFTEVMERLEERLNYPFEGYVTYKGDDGIEAAEILDEKMMKNVSR